MRHLLRAVLIAIALVIGYWTLGIVIYRFVDPPLTPLMAIRLIEGDGLRRNPVALSGVSRELSRAVVAAEDNRFCFHFGIDFAEVQNAVEEYREGGRLRGASTISMQVARNLFLWPGGGFLRKAIEAPLALAIDLAWPKRRILEVYLNIAEWGPGRFGAAAAAEVYFHKPPSQLTRREAALMAAILPSPRHWNAARPTAYVSSRAYAVAARIPTLDPDYFRCFE
ncbi:MAG: monofunctional biosynthetic peptidoglycan transglycosylase [Alphaproteobacteria bacterium]|nr:monofunctional biosynthetic peptidoglycan transglycosylase [Alphaproteobacteria bacterium]